MPPRDRAVGLSEVSPDESAEDDGCIVPLVLVSSSSFSTDTNRRVRGRTAEVDRCAVVVVVSALELIPVW